MKLFIRHSIRKVSHMLGVAMYLFLAIRLIPHIIHYLSEDDNCPLKEDIKVWKKNYWFINWNMPEVCVFIKLMTYYPEFRNLFYFRAYWQDGIFEFLCPPMDSLFIKSNYIGPGFFISHGFATIIAAKEIGKNFYLHQQVTIGWKGDAQPVIGDNVQMGAGSIAVGGITIGNNVTVGAGTTVTKDIADNSVVVGGSAYFIKKNGNKIKEKL